MNNWIPANTPPDSEREVLIVSQGSYVGSFVTMGHYENGVWYEYDYDGEWPGDAIELPERVTHWQDLPALPEDL